MTLEHDSWPEREDSAEKIPRGIQEWTDQTSRAERVIAVALSLENPQTASWVSNEAQVAENTARKYLEMLEDLWILTSADHGAKTYYPDSGYLRFRDVSHFKRKYNEEELSGQLADLENRAEMARERYGVENPADLREEVADEDAATEKARKYRRAASEWESLEYRMSVLRESIAQLEGHNHSHQHQVV